MEHTPWKLTSPDLNKVRDANGKYLGAFRNDMDAIRAVECVNACADMQDPVAEIAQLRARVSELENPWISVKERLPENGKYLTLGYDGHDAYNMMFENGKWLDPEYNWENACYPDRTRWVTHWMPLPSPPKPQEP